MNKQMKDLYDNTVLETMYLSLNREIPKKCSLYSPIIKHAPSSSSYGNLDMKFYRTT